LLITVQLPATSEPVHSPLAPLQYCVIGRVRPSEPHRLPVQPYSVHVRHTALAFLKNPPSQHGPLVHCAGLHAPPPQP
jgi:hypothetical protein